MKLIDTFAVVDTGNVITHKKDFCVVSLRQGNDDSKMCTVSLETWSRDDIMLMDKEEEGEPEDGSDSEQY